MDCPPPENIIHEIRNEAGNVISHEGVTIVYKCGDAMTELILKQAKEAKALLKPVEPPQ